MQTQKRSILTRTIFIRDTFNETDKSYFCHEFFHFIADTGNKTTGGFEYLVDYQDKTYKFGTSLNESICNYFSTKVIAHPSEMCIYQLETLLAEMLAKAYGEERLFEAYRTGDIESLKK